MALPRINPTHTAAWEKLETHYNAIRRQHMTDWFAEDPNRQKEFTVKWQHFTVDYAKHRITTKTRSLLIKLAKEMHLQEAIDQQFEGQKINETEERAVLHTALRSPRPSREIKETLQKMEAFSSAVISGEQKGYTGKSITDVVNIGIGGSDLGPKMITRALQFYRNHLNLHFVSNVDPNQIGEIQRKINPETTLFIVVSKSFSTLETLTNARSLRQWLVAKTGDEKAVSRHFVAVSSNPEGVRQFGIVEKNIFPMWDWVGGRFSLWSAVGLSVCCAVGFKHFKALLHGAQKMDTHFKATDFEENIPVITALLSIWYNNFFGAETEAVIPYSHYLGQLIPYLQQAFMESNGKSISRNGNRVDYQTGNIIWGAPGTNAQHAFFQLLHQGTKLVPCDFIGFKEPLHNNKAGHKKLMANFFAQSEALMKGKTKAEVTTDLRNLPPTKRNRLAPHKVFEGNKPSTTLLIDKLTPENLGSLIALYEHKIFVEGVIWNIYSYDQWGVELGKELASAILHRI